MNDHTIKHTVSKNGTVTVENYDKKTEVNTSKKRTYKKYWSFICKISNPATFCWTDLMKEIISGDENVNNLVRKNKTNLLFSIFQNKENAYVAVQCAIKICEDIQNRVIKLNLYDRTLVDKIILILKVHKHDLQHFYQNQIPFVNSKDINETNYWIYLNITAKASLKGLCSWQSQLMLPIFTEIMKYETNKSLIDWLSNQYASFDDTQLANTDYFEEEGSEIDDEYNNKYVDTTEYVSGSNNDKYESTEESCLFEPGNINPTQIPFQSELDDTDSEQYD